MLPILSLRPNSHLGILVPHSGSIPGLRSRPNLDLGTSLGLGTSMLYRSNHKKFLLRIIFTFCVFFLSRESILSRDCTCLVSRTIYFNTSQYQCIVSNLPLFKKKNLFVYIFKINKYQLYIYNFNYLVKVNLLSN